LWNSSGSPTGGDWDVGTNWVGGKVPTSQDSAVIQGLSSPGTVLLQSNLADSVASLVTDSSTTLEVTNGSLSIGAAPSSTLGGPVEIDSGAALQIASSAILTLGAGQTLRVDGTLSLGANDSVTFPTAQFATTQIVVNGLLTATSAQFINSGSATASETQIYVGSGGELKVSSSTFAIDNLRFPIGSIVSSGDLSANAFDTTIDISALDLPQLADNQSFDDVNILPETLTSGQTVSLDSIGNLLTTNLRYLFPGGFTVGAGATLNVNSGVSVLISDAEQLVVDGTFNITSAQSFAIEDQNDGSLSGGITVNGTINISNTKLTRSGGTNGDDTTFLQVNSGASATITGSTFAWDQLLLNSGASSIAITGNDFSDVGADGIVASGDPSSHIPLAQNYWGTSDTTQIDAKILDNKDNTNLPTVDYLPIVNATITAASPAQASSSPNDQLVTLSATIRTLAGDPVTGGTVTFTVKNGTQVIGNPTSPAAVSSGLASAQFTLPGGTPIGHYVIEASYDGTSLFLPSIDASYKLTVTVPSPPAALVVHLEPSSNATAGQTFGAQPVIYVEDQFGALVTSDNSTVVTVALASGTDQLHGTLAATVSGGIATFTDLFYDEAEQIKLLFSSGSLVTATSTPINVSPATVAKLVITQQPSASATAGVAFTTQPVVAEEDQFGNIVSDDNSTVVAVTLGSGAGPLQGTSQVTVASGLATFNDLFDKRAESITLKFASGSLATDTSNSILVSPAAPTNLVIAQQASTSATADGPFTTQPVIHEVDQYGNIVTTDSTSIVTAMLKSGAGPLTGISVTLSSGVATFTSLGDQKAESVSFIFTSGSLTSPASTVTIVSPGLATQLVFDIPPFTTVTAGTPLTDPIVLHEEDQHGNIVTGDNSTVVTVSLGSGGGSLMGPKTAKVSAGVASFDFLEDDTAGSLTLKFEAPGLPPVVSEPTTVKPAPAVHLNATRPPGGVVAGHAFTLKVEAQDPYGNIDTSYTGNVSVGLPSGSTATLTGTLTTPAQNGVATFTDLVSDTSGPLSLTATSGSLTAAISPPISIAPASAVSLAFTVPPASLLIAGQPFAIVVAADDQYANVDTNYTGQITIAIAGEPNFPMTVQATNGVATFTGLTLPASAKGSTIEATANGLNKLVSKPLDLEPVPTIIGESVLMARKTSKNGKPVGKPTFQGFEIDFSTPMNLATAGQYINYRLVATTTKRVKKKTVTVNTPVPFKAAYSQANGKYSVLLTVKSSKPFAKGGLITVNDSPPDGVSSQAGILLSPGQLTFKISAKAKSLVPGVAQLIVSTKIN
jgi:hypothetical protein